MLGDYPPGVTGAEKAIAGDPFNDYFTDYEATDEQLIDWLVEDPDGVLKELSSYKDALDILREAYKETHQLEIQKEYEEQ